MSEAKKEAIIQKLKNKKKKKKGSRALTQAEIDYNKGVESDRARLFRLVKQLDPKSVKRESEM